MQQGVQMDATCNIQQCWELLANNVASVCMGPYKKSSFKKEIQGNSLLSYYTEVLLKCYCVMSEKRLVKHENVNTVQTV